MSAEFELGLEANEARVGNDVVNLVGAPYASARWWHDAADKLSRISAGQLLLVTLPYYTTDDEAEILCGQDVSRRKAVSKRAREQPYIAVMNGGLLIVFERHELSATLLGIELGVNLGRALEKMRR